MQAFQPEDIRPRFGVCSRSMRRYLPAFILALAIAPFPLAGCDMINKLKGGSDDAGLDAALEAAAVVVEPSLARWRDRIGELAGVAPVLAGSGATWFVPGKRDDALVSLRSEGASVVVARTATAAG